MIQPEDKLLAKIKSEFSGPRIGIIGATSPDYQYSTEIGNMAGFFARKFLDSFLNGFVFTGGVEGVGVDAFMGVSMHCISEKISNPKFFVLIPSHVQVPVNPIYQEEEEDDETPQKFILQRYYLPRSYGEIKKFLDIQIGKNTIVPEVLAGESMGVRRDYVAACASVLIVVNGGNGTLDEAVSAIHTKVPVIVCRNSGGAASALADLKEGLSPSDRKYIGLYSEGINKDLIHIAEDQWDIPEILSSLIK